LSAWSTDPPPTPYYIVSPPKVIPIDVGRQLFVDNFLIEQTTLTKTFHPAEYYTGNPVLYPDKPWEFEGEFPSASAMGGTWYDPSENLFKMWYGAGSRELSSACIATSVDGLSWVKPDLGVIPGTNKTVRTSGGNTVVMNASTVWLDLEETNPQKRYKAIRSRKHEGFLTFHVYKSPDGIHWGPNLAESGNCGDTTSMFYNPFLKKWVWSAKENVSDLKRRCYWECDDLVTGSYWTDAQHLASKWVCADTLDPVLPGVDCAKLYNMDCVAYESLMLGMFNIWRGEPPDRLKPNNILLGFSRDGFTWDRTCRDAFIAVSEHYGDWNWCKMISAGGCCLVVGDKLYFYVQGRSGVLGTDQVGIASTGLAMLRRDGFASLDAGSSEGTITTRPVRFDGRYMFVNVDADGGELRVEVLNGDNQVIAPFSKANCVPISVDKTLQAVTWNGAADLSALSGKPVKFRFYLTNGKLYSFWVSPETSGASHGYVAAGGPGFTGATDTVGGP